jgi:hypothetical protein
MTTDEDMKIDYAVVLKQLHHELDGLDGRRQALLATIAGMKRLVDADDDGQPMTDEQRGRQFPRTEFTDVRMPVIPPGFFVGKSPTDAYRALMERWQGHYTPPQIADLFKQGGMEAPSRTALIQAIHSVVKRERARELARNGTSPLKRADF